MDASLSRKVLIMNSTLEFVLTLALLFGVTSIVRFAMGPSAISRAFPEIHIQLLIVGISVGLVISGLILSPLGKRSGGHMNPAISLAMWRYGVFPAHGVLPYIMSQLLGSLIGVWAAELAWGPVVAIPPVSFAVLQPAPGWGDGELFIAEAASMALIVFVIGLCLTNRRLAKYVPWIVGVLIGAAIAMLGTSTGGSVNPARQFGPAIASGQTRFLWVYLFAPFIGAIIAVWLRDFVQDERVLTHKLCGHDLETA